MRQMPELIVMLTHNDRTVPDAPELFAKSKQAKAAIWGFKEEGLPLARMQQLYASMREAGKRTALEVVAYTEAEGLAGARIAAECGVDYFMGTKCFPSIAAFCRQHGLKYLPFVGHIEDRPSVLSGSIDEMIEEAKDCLSLGAWGIDLLAYRYTGDCALLISRFCREVEAPVCLAGSVNSEARLDEVKRSGCWSFTIGGAFFEHRFGADFAEQIDRVAAFLEA